METEGERFLYGELLDFYNRVVQSPLRKAGELYERITKLKTGMLEGFITYALAKKGFNEKITFNSEPSRRSAEFKEDQWIEELSSGTFPICQAEDYFPLFHGFGLPEWDMEFVRRREKSLRVTVLAALIPAISWGEGGIEHKPPEELLATKYDKFRRKREEAGDDVDQLFIVNPEALGISETKKHLKILLNEDVLWSTDELLDRVTKDEQEKLEAMKEWIRIRDGAINELLTRFPDLSLARGDNGATVISRLIDYGEGERLEFKSTLRFDLHERGMEYKHVEHQVVKAICGFLNQREGGKLLIGVGDDGKIIGLQRDYETLGGGRDEFKHHLRQVVSSQLGEMFNDSLTLRILEKDNKDVCLVEVKQGRKLAGVEENGQKKCYIRSGNRTIPLDPTQIPEYVQENWWPKQ